METKSNSQGAGSNGGVSGPVRGIRDWQLAAALSTRTTFWELMGTA